MHLANAGRFRAYVTLVSAAVNEAVLWPARPNHYLASAFSTSFVCHLGLLFLPPVAIATANLKFSLVSVFDIRFCTNRLQTYSYSSCTHCIKSSTGISYQAAWYCDSIPYREVRL